jgi:hypothetical protein
MVYIKTHFLLLCGLVKCPAVVWVNCPINVHLVGPRHGRGNIFVTNFVFFRKKLKALFTTN